MELGIAAVCNARDPFRSTDAGHVFWRAAGYSRANFLDNFLDYAVRGQGNKEETVREPMEKLHIKTHQEALELMETAAKAVGCKVYMLSVDEGRGGYNYGGSAGKDIMIAPFIKCSDREKVGKYTIPRKCNDPIECMLITFFHELSHCIFHNLVPREICTYFHEMWITLLGIDYARRTYGICFSDAAARWMAGESETYLKDEQEETNK